MKHYGLTKKKMMAKLAAAGIAGLDLDEKAERASRKMLLLGRVRSSKKSPRFFIGPMPKTKANRYRGGTTITRGAPKMFDDHEYVNKAELKALKRAKVARLKAAQLMAA